MTAWREEWDCPQCGSHYVFPVSQLPASMCCIAHAYRKFIPDLRVVYLPYPVFVHGVQGQPPELPGDEWKHGGPDAEK